MKVVIGLGNPGEKYTKTRHNIGFMAVDRIKQDGQDFRNFVEKKKFLSLISEGYIDRNKVLLIKPLTFVNNSGEAVYLLKKFYNLGPKDFIIIQDDSDLPLGKLKIKTGGSGAGHKGIASVNSVLENYTRVLIGVRDFDRDKGKKSLDFVLDKFPKSKIEIIEEKIKAASDAVNQLIADDSIDIGK